MARRKGRRRQRKGREIDLVLWGGGAVVAVAVARALFGFVGEHWPLFAAAGLVAAVAAVAFPLIRARRVAQRQRQWFADHLELARVDELSGSDFETLTAELLRRDGFRHVRELGRAGDMGVDITAVGPDGRRFASSASATRGRWAPPRCATSSARSPTPSGAHRRPGHLGPPDPARHGRGERGEADPRRTDQLAGRCGGRSRWSCGTEEPVRTGRGCHTSGRVALRVQTIRRADHMTVHTPRESKLTIIRGDPHGRRRADGGVPARQRPRLDADAHPVRVDRPLTGRYRPRTVATSGAPCASPRRRRAPHLALVGRPEAVRQTVTVAY
ncbi:restriction endonuclease [Nonomuraea dietziae]|uniref:restriction endonuclease n=2 Tax=Nonomuraea TaxID=83681 RepID=UPI0031D2CF19